MCEFDYIEILMIFAGFNCILCVLVLLCVKPLHNRITTLISHINELKELEKKRER